MSTTWSTSLSVSNLEQLGEFIFNVVCVYLELNVTVTADYTAVPEEDPGELGPNEFTAGSALFLHCTVQGNSGDLVYNWSITGNPDTPDCSNCHTVVSTATTTLQVGHPALSSYNAGIYTCTVSESGRHESRSSGMLAVKVIGKPISMIHECNGVIWCNVQGLEYI